MPESIPVDEQSPYEILLGRIDEIIARWRELVGHEPWADLAPSRLVNSMPEILPKIFRGAAAGEAQVNLELSDLIARAHGLHRREDAVPLVAVAEEWSHVKQACWDVLRNHGISEDSAKLAVQRIDALVDDAVGYTLRGYYSPELDTLRGKGLERRGGREERRKNSGTRRAKGD
jgi:hypothetical protein